jgi:hypothetical protein
MKQALLTLLTITFTLSLHASCIKGNCKNGTGTYQFKNGYIYKGEFKNNKPHGKGILKGKSTSLFKGNWRNGIKHGAAVIKSKDGNKLYCKYTKGVRQGNGKLVNAEGITIMNYQWKNGKLIKKYSPKRVKNQKQNQSSIVETESKMDQPAIGESPSEESTPEKVEEETTVAPELIPGTLVSFGDKYSYNTGDGSFFGNLLGGVLTANYSIKFYGVVEQKLGDRYKITITDGRIIDPNWASMNYFEYKPYAIDDMNKRIGQSVFMTVAEVTIED